MNSVSPEDRLRFQQWKNLNFGLFIHYGLYSIPGGIWKGQNITRGYSEQILPNAPVPPDEYQALTASFDAKSFDAHRIVRLAKSAGMRYVVITSKHHDGFCLFNTATTSYNSVNSAAGRDLLKELSEACRLEDMGFGVYFSLIDWHYPHALPYQEDNCNSIPEKHHRYNMAQLTELLTSYGPICELWFDMGHPTRQQSREMRQLIRRCQPQAMINGRIWNNQEDFLVMGDNEIPGFSMDTPWQTPASIYKETWGYRSWQKRGNPEDKIHELVRQLSLVSSRGGNYLLNIGPRGDGSPLPFEEQILEGIGRWLSRNSEAVFNVQPGPWNNAEWGAATRTSTALYLHLHRFPEKGFLELPGIRKMPVSVYPLSRPGLSCPAALGRGGLTVNLENLKALLKASEELTVIKLLFDSSDFFREDFPAVPAVAAGAPAEVESRRIYRFQGEDYNSCRAIIAGEEWKLRSEEEGTLLLKIPCRPQQCFTITTEFPGEKGDKTQSLDENGKLEAGWEPC